MLPGLSDMAYFATDRQLQHLWSTLLLCEFCHAKGPPLLYLTSLWPENMCLKTVSGGRHCKGSYSSSTFLGRSANRHSPHKLYFIKNQQTSCSLHKSSCSSQSESQTIQYCRATELSLGLGFADGNISMQASSYLTLAHSCHHYDQ